MSLEQKRSINEADYSVYPPLHEAQMRQAYYRRFLKGLPKGLEASQVRGWMWENRKKLRRWNTRLRDKSWRRSR